MMTPTRTKMVIVSTVSICLLCCLGSLAALQHSLPESEMSALRAIASKLEISPKVWNFNVNPCSKTSGWISSPPSVNIQTNTAISNLTCGHRDPTTNISHVVSIILKSMNLTGVLPEEFANLTHLENLDLSRNVLSGTIPVAWRSLRLFNLSLLGNRVSGEIPHEIGEISTLNLLSLEDNLLEGSIPPSLGRLTNLARLLLSANDLTGELPEAMGNLRSLTDFRIDGTSISGKIPAFLGNWTLLGRLDLQGTSLEGPFPPTLSNLKNLRELRVSDFKGDGTFPPIEGMNLQTLILRNCSISGLIPGFIGRMNNLRTLDLSFNKFNGRIPSELRLLIQQIDFMYLTDNMLNGTIPEWIFGNKQIDLSYNSFTGPDKGSCQKKFVNLASSFSSSENSLTTWCLMKNLPCFKKATNYQLFINCGGANVVVDGIDYEEDTNGVGESMFFLSNDQKWAYSSTGDFAGNRNGKYTFTNASVLNISDPTLYLSARTAASSLKYYGICLQRGNYTVKLHFAEIILTNDKTFSSVGRRFFDVFIQGQQVLKNFNIAEASNGTCREVVKSFTAFVDNTLEIHLRWTGKGTNAIPDRGVYGPLISAISVTPNFKPVLDKKGFPVGGIVGIIIASFVLILLVILLPWILLHKERQDYQKLKNFKIQGARFTLNQIVVATNNFDPINRIGEGGFGPVYKGVLPDDRVVAVKQHSPMSQQGLREFLNEIGLISALDHPNLVKLFGCCVEGDQLLLVYEYMENNCLARALFGPDETKLNLSWQTRRKIALDIARGLAYLHEECKLKIVHRDIKPTNVLLDKELNAKICDFGLAKLDEGCSHISTRIAGTMGYMAPEYATRGYLTEKADVFSFGVVILEIVSGKKNANHRPDYCSYLLDHAYVLHGQGRLLELVDPMLGSDYSTFEAEQLLKLAIICTNPSPALRPTMSSVVSIIEDKEHITVVKPIHDLDDEKGLMIGGYYSRDGPEISSNGPWTDSSLTANRIRHVMTPSMPSQRISYKFS